MEYISTKQYSFTTHPYRNIMGAKVIIFDAVPENISLYSRHFQEAKIDLTVVERLEELIKHVSEIAPDVVIINPEDDYNRSYQQIAFVKIKFPTMPIITIGESIRDDSLDVMMQLGVSFYLDRKLTRPRDLMLAIEQTLNT